MAKIESMEPGSILRLVPTEIIKSESKHPYLNKITGRRYWLDTYILHGFRERLPFGPSLIKQRFIYISKVGSLHNICLYNNFKNNFFGKGYSTLVLPELEVSKIGHIIDIRKLDTIKDSFFSRKIDYKFNFTPPIQSLLQSISKQSQKTVDDKLAFYNRNTILPFIEDMGDLYALLALRENNSCNYCGSYFWSNKTKIIHYGNFNQKKIRSKTIRIIKANSFNTVDSSKIIIFPVLYLCSHCNNITVLASTEIDTLAFIPYCFQLEESFLNTEEK